MGRRSCVFIKTICFFINLLFDGLSNPFKKVSVDTSKKMMILANGPSLNTLLEKISEDIQKYSQYEYSVVNDFVHNDLFEVLKPKHYTLSDPMFFRETPQKEKGVGILKALEKKVDWDMYLYIRKGFRKSSFLEGVRRNKHIHIICYHHPKYEGWRKLTNWIYKRGWGNGEYSTVVLNSLYVSLTEGFKDIELYGVDHSFFTGLTVDNNNVPCYIVSHFYDNNTELKPIANVYDFKKEHLSMAEFLLEKYDIFSGHEIMSAYAKYMDARVVNCTKNSLIDAYPRK